MPVHKTMKGWPMKGQRKGNQRKAYEMLTNSSSGGCKVKHLLAYHSESDRCIYKDVFIKTKGIFFFINTSLNIENILVFVISEIKNAFRNSG